MLSDEPTDGASLLVPATLLQTADFGLRTVILAMRQRYFPLSSCGNVAARAKSNGCFLVITYCTAGEQAVQVGKSATFSRMLPVFRTSLDKQEEEQHITHVHV